MRIVETETGADGAPAVTSGAVRSSATVAGHLDRQADQVVVALKPDVQARAVAHAKQLAALSAAPLAGLEDRPNALGGR